MKLRWIASIWLVVVLMIIIAAIPVFAGDTTTITVILVPETTSGISNFHIVYINDQRIDLSWNFGSGVSNIMIRAKYGSYPNDISDGSETPSDGYLVYYGNGSNTSDTLVNMDDPGDINISDTSDTPFTIYYKAWGQNIDGSWQTSTNTGWEESIELILLAFVFTILSVGIINFGFLRNSFIPYKLAGAFLWLIPVVWIITNPPSVLIAGSTLQTVTLIVLICIALISLFGAFRQPLQINTSQTINGITNAKSQEDTGWHLPKFIQNTNSYEYQKQARKISLNEYRERAHNAVFPRRNRR